MALRTQWLNCAWVCVCVCVCARMCACVRMWMHDCVHICVCLCIYARIMLIRFVYAQRLVQKKNNAKLIRTEDKRRYHIIHIRMVPVSINAPIRTTKSLFKEKGSATKQRNNLTYSEGCTVMHTNVSLDGNHSYGHETHDLSFLSCLMMWIQLDCIVCMNMIILYAWIWLYSMCACHNYYVICCHIMHIDV